MSSLAIALIFFVIFQNIEQTNIPQQDIIVQTFRQNVSEDSQDISENPQEITENPQEISKSKPVQTQNIVSQQSIETNKQIPEIIA
jgi:flagellar motor protein MotB